MKTEHGGSVAAPPPPSSQTTAAARVMIQSYVDRLIASWEQPLRTGYAIPNQHLHI